MRVTGRRYGSRRCAASVDSCDRAEAGPDDVAIVRAAGDAIRHRGPDHGATAPLGRCTLGYRRLSVIDLATGDQPVANEDGAVVAVFNGEIYNYRELRAELEAQGHDLRGTGDTPTLPHLYEQHGDAFVEHLDGMFALAIWDAARQRLDPGPRPLRQEAAPLDAAPGRHGRVRLGAEGPADASRAFAGRSSSSASTRTWPSATCPATAPRCAGSTGCHPGARSPSRTAPPR